MSERSARIFREQRGVAMITVLLIAAALTAVTSAAAFVTIDEFGAGRADRNAAEALAFAEAGIDRLLLKIRNGDLTWNNISLAGCDAQHPEITVAGTVGGGSYNTTLTVYEPLPASGLPEDRFPKPGGQGACLTASTTFKKVTQRYFVISSTGTKPAARRLIRQVVLITPLGLPVGIYAYDRIDANGTVQMQNISMVTEGTVSNRDNIGFSGTDPFYTLADFYGPKVSAANGVRQMPSAVHAKGAIYYGPASKFIEHRPGKEPNCDADVNPKGVAGHQLWDGSGTAVIDTYASTCPAWTSSGGSNYIVTPADPTIITPSTVTPPSSMFTEADRARVALRPTLTEQDYLTLRTAAKQNGVYCTGATALDLSCTEFNRSETPVNPYLLTAGKLGPDDVDDPTGRSFVVYIDFANNGLDPFTRKIEWTGGTNIGPCNTDPATNRSAVIVVRRGTIDFAGGSTINGMLLVPEGAVETSGGFTMEGTIIARRVESKGTSTIRLSPCWLQNIPGPFLDISTTEWREVDR